MNKTHLIYIPFTGVGKKQYMGDDWLRDRIEIFKAHTLKSLLNQTKMGFVPWLSFRPEEKTNQIVKELLTYLIDINVRFIVTFNGLIYHDDRNEEMVKTLPRRLTESLLAIRQQPYTSSWWATDYIYLTRIDSDDMFREDAIDLIQSQKSDAKALTFQLGYVYNKDTNQLAEWNPLTNPPFHTVIFPTQVFFDPERHIDWYEGFKSHEDIARLPHRVLWQGDNRQDRLYCVLTHNPEMHISTNWNHPFRGKEIIEGKEEILSKFGI